MISVTVSEVPLDLNAAQVPLLKTGAGAIASFTGLVRADDGIRRLNLSHYPGMTERALTVLAEEAQQRWALQGVVLIHRVGPMAVGEPIVFVGTAAPHRGDALAACTYLIDRLKTDAPFWKKEELADGSSRWVEARQSDDTAAARWE